MNKLYNLLFIFLLNITYIISPKENIQKPKYSLRSISYKLNNSWHNNNWVKAGSVATICALFYFFDKQFHFFAVPLAAAATNVASSELNKKEKNEQQQDPITLSSNLTQSTTISTSTIIDHKNKVVSLVKNFMTKTIDRFNDSIVTEK